MYSEVPDASLRSDSRIHHHLGILVDWGFGLPQKSLFWLVLNLPDLDLSESCGQYSVIPCDGPSIMCSLILKDEVLWKVSAMKEKYNRMNPHS